MRKIPIFRKENDNKEVEKAQLQETKITALTTENQVLNAEIQEIKQAFQKVLELIEIKIPGDKDRADKAEQELSVLKARNQIITTTATNAVEELKICLEGKNKAESHCYDQFAGLNPQDTLDEL